MSDPHQLDRELREYLEKEPNLRREDRLIYLKTILNKYLEFNKLSHVINSGDLYEIIADAKNRYTNMKIPVKVSKKQLDHGETINLPVIEAIIVYLNKKFLLKKQVQIDYDQ